MLKVRSLTLIALFQIILGAGILAGGLCSKWDALFYFWLFRSNNAEEYADLQYKGENEEGTISIQPYKRTELPRIPIISIDKNSSMEAFSNYPAQPMDWAVIFYRLRNLGVDHIGILSPLVWDEHPNDIVTEALSHELKAFPSWKIGKTLSLSARESLLPKQWEQQALSKDQYVGNTKKLPSANKFYGETPQLSEDIAIVPSIIENDDLFSPASHQQSMPLFIRWQDSILPTLPLLIALDAMHLTTKDIYVHFGGSLRLGNKINIPIDEIGRIPLSLATRDDQLDLSSVISENSPIAKHTELTDKQKTFLHSLSSAPAILIAEAPLGAETPHQSAFLTARTIKNLFPDIQPCAIKTLHPVSLWIQWILLIDVLVIGFWALRFRGWVRWSLLSFCIGIIPVIALYKWISSTEWLPLTPYIVSVAFLFLLKRFLPSDKDDDELPEEKEIQPEKATSPRHSIPAPEHDFTEPDEVPIPKQNGKSKSR